MAQIIKQSFNIKDFDALVNDFIFSSTEICLPANELLALRERLIETGPDFIEIFKAYYNNSGNKRYDYLTDKMEQFIQKLIKCNSGLRKNEQDAFLLFWAKVAAVIKADYYQMNDQYLTNSCSYFISAIHNI